jgi:hypothetical protein
VNLLSRILFKISLAEPKAKSKKMSPSDPVEEEEKAEVEAEPRSEKEEENLGKASPKDISDTHLLPCNVALLDDLPDKMDDPGVPTISCLIGSQKFDQALRSWSKHEHHAKGNLQLAESLFLDTYFPTSAAGRSIDLASSGNHGRYPGENREFFCACGLRGIRQWPPKNVVAAWIIKLNIRRKGETFIFKPKGTKKCNQVMVMIKPERNAMTPNTKPNVAKNFSMNFS